MENLVDWGIALVVVVGFVFLVRNRLKVREFAGRFGGKSGSQPKKDKDKK